MEEPAGTSSKKSKPMRKRNKFFPVPPGWIMSGYRRISPGDGNYVQDINEEFTIKGYRTDGLKLAIFYFLNVCLFGIPIFFIRWNARWKVNLTCRPCSLKNATIIYVRDENKETSTCPVVIEFVEFIPDEFASRSAATQQLDDQDCKTPLCDAENAGSVYRYFVYHEEKFIWDDERDLFKRIEGLADITCQQVAEKFRGMCPKRREQLSEIFGTNEIFVEVKSYLRLLLDEVINPFYVFQVFSMILWCFDEYYYYAICVICISAVSVSTSLVKIRQQAVVLKNMAESGEMDVTVRLPDGSEEIIDFRKLVPGDVILIPAEGCLMPCDAVLIQGSCIVNESMLTGESVPVNKSAIEPSEEMFTCENYKKHVIFCGTNVIQPRFYAGNKVACVVVRTGFATLKGQLIRSMMYPKAVEFKFYSDSIKFTCLLFCVALCGMVYGIYLYAERGTTWYILLVRVLDIVTIVVPPALPAAMTVGTLSAQGRLSKQSIFCISPQRINFCGKLKLICFDKTGTLTEDGLNLSCVVPATKTSDGEDVFEDTIADPQEISTSSHFLRGMATCHSLTHINKKIVGDPLDLKMFESTGWTLEEPMVSDDNSRYDMLSPNVVKKGEIQLGIIKEFDFTPQLQRMAVVVNCLESREMVAYCKGAPEKIRPLCSTVPENYDMVLDSFTLRGYRVLALAHKKVEGISWHQLQRVSREKIESDLTFAGFLVMQNSLKPTTIPVMKDLMAANLRCVMVTGDNMLTALSVARECSMIPAQDKVVIVNVTDEGEIEYTLAAQHYEIPEGDTHAPDTSRISNNNGESNVRFAPGPGVQDASSAQGMRRLSRHRFSLESNEADQIIDMERLIPIGRDLLQGSNFHFALTGKTWTYLQQNCSKEDFQRILAKGTVFARMTPECKMQLIEALQEMDYIVAMCGDGANDCSALSAAHVGISLSEAEASVAAPFTSKIPDISCVPLLIQEGRCALVTSFGVFKYMALYSLVQFASVLILYTSYSNLADAHFLWIDLAITSTVTIAMGRTEPVQHLVARNPMGSLVSFANIFSIFSQIVVCVLLQVCSMEYLKLQSWFHPVKPTSADELTIVCWESTTIFSVSSFQYLIMSVVFSKGQPFRKPFYFNRWLLSLTVFLTGFTALLVLYPFPLLSDFFSLTPLAEATQYYRFHLLMFPAANLFISVILEHVISVSRPVKWLGKSLWRSSKKHQYKKILKNLANDKTWPPIKTE